MSENLDINALFLGSKAENSEILEKLILESFRDHTFWRRNFHPEDPLSLTHRDKRSEGYEKTVDDFQAKFYELLAKLKQSVPFHSPRYLGHMTADTLMPAFIGYFSTMLYNPNNVGYETSPVTSNFEIEVGRDLADMMGFDSSKSWAHITSGGTVANIEALWVIRNHKYFPLIVKDLVQKYRQKMDVELPNGQVKDISEIKDDYTLLSLSPESLSDLTFRFFSFDWGFNIQEDVYKDKRNISHSGMHEIPVGKVLIPASKHYSWPKAAEILGIGRSNIEHVKVDSNFRMDAHDLKQKLIKLHEQKIPVLAVVGIVGATECGSIDPVDKIVELRRWYEKECNSSFMIHIDAAYGGYPRSIFIEKDNKTFRKLDDVRKDFKGSKFFKWPSEEVYNAYKAVEEVDSVTVDPHKLGYIPYPAGAVVYRDKRVKPATMCKAPYINNTTKADDDDAYIGGYILEGSKPGAAASACWLAHEIIPLNKNGYGKIISGPVQNAHLLYDLLRNTKFEGADCRVLNIPDLDILLYVFNPKGNKSLKAMNDFNDKLLEEFSYHLDKVTPAHEFFISSTELHYDIYGDAVSKAVEELGINLADWTENIKFIKVLRTSVVTPLVSKKDSQEYYWNKFIQEIKRVLEKIV